jgi:hypothetical protein
VFNLTNGSETPQSLGALPGSLFQGLITSEPDLSSSEAAIALLQEIAREQEYETWRTQYVRTQKKPYETSAPLQKVPPGPWRSLGGYFDYSHWADRDRFAELDKAIAAGQRNQPFEDETEAEVIDTNAVCFSGLNRSTTAA